MPMCSDCTGATEAAATPVSGEAGRPAGSRTHPPPASSIFKEPLMDKSSLNRNGLPLDTITGFYTFLGQWDLHEPAGTASPQSVPVFCPVCSPSLSADHVPAPTGTADPPLLRGLPGILWCVGGHLSHAQKCGGKGKRKKKPSSLTPTGSESAMPVCPLGVRYGVPLGFAL